MYGQNMISKIPTKEEAEMLLCEAEARFQQKKKQKCCCVRQKSEIQVHGQHIAEQRVIVRKKLRRTVKEWRMRRRM